MKRSSSGGAQERPVWGPSSGTEACVVLWVKKQVATGQPDCQPPPALRRDLTASTAIWVVFRSRRFNLRSQDENV